MIKKPRIALFAGDPAGIGPEIVAKLLAEPETTRSADVLLIAGKGHELGQIVGKTVLPFSDHDAVAAALKGEDNHG